MLMMLKNDLFITFGREISCAVLKKLVAEKKSEVIDIKLVVFCRKKAFPSLFRGKLFNFVRVELYNKVQPQQISQEEKLK